MKFAFGLLLLAIGCVLFHVMCSPPGDQLGWAALSGAIVGTGVGLMIVEVMDALS